MKIKSNNGKYIYFSAIAILLVVFSIFILEKLQVTNLYTRPANTDTIEDLRPVNDVQYTPADPTDNDEINKQKEDITNSTTEPDNETKTINVVLTAAGQDEVGGPVIVKALLNDVKNGTCDLRLSKDGVERNYSASVINTGTYYSCDGFEVPLDELSAGSWNITLTVSSDDRTGIAEQTTEVTL